LAYRDAGTPGRHHLSEGLTFMATPSHIGMICRSVVLIPRTMFVVALAEQGAHERAA